jgi:glycosyltransferase involved in cell wall biosynthesis
VKEPLNEYPSFRGTIIEKIWRCIEITIARRVDIMVFTSKGSFELYNKEYPKLLQNKDVRIVYLGVDMTELDRADFKKNTLLEYGIKEGKIVILCVGKLIIEKGIDTLIEAIALLPDDIKLNLSCLIIGEGYMKNELQSLINRKDLNQTISILNFLPRHILLDLYKFSNIFVLPNRVAVFDYALLEAAALKLPVITTNIGGNLEMFADDSALLVSPDNPKVLADAIFQLVTNRELRNIISEKAYNRVQNNFSLKIMLKNYLDIYEELLSFKERKNK